MLKAINRISIVLMLLFVSSTLHPKIANAQAAKAIFAQVSGQVVDLNGSPIAGAAVQLEGPVTVKAIGDRSGHFVFANVSPGTYTIVASAAGYDIVTRNGIAVQNEDISLDIRLAGTTALKEIGHVATTSGRSSINVTAAPTYILTPQDMAFQGQTEWKKVLEEIPGVSVTDAAAGLGSQIPGAPTNGQVVSIRGSLPYETALLIDNMPMYGMGNNTYPGEGTDLGTYNPQTFNSFDVTEGPGAQSPSIVDSIGGSLNLHPAGQVTQNSYNFSVSDDPWGGLIANGTVAMHMGKLSATATYGFDNSPGPISGGSQLIGGGINGEINAINGIPFVCNGSCARTYLFSHGATGFLYTGQTSGLIGCCLPDGNSGWIDHSASLSLFYQLSSSTIAQFFFAGSNQISGYAEGDLPTIFTPPAGYAGSLPSGSVSFPSASGLGLYEPGTNQQESQIYEGKITFQLRRGQLQLAALSNTSGAQPLLSAESSLGSVRLYGGGSYCYTPPCSVAPLPPGFNAFTPVVFNGTSNTVSIFSNDCVQNRVAHNRDLSVNYATPLGENSRATASFVQSYYDYAYYYNYVFSGYPDGTGGTFGGTYINLPQSNFETTDEMHLGYGLTPSDRTSLDLSYYFAQAHYHVLNPNDPTASTYVGQSFAYNAPRASFVWRPNSSLAVRASTGGGFALPPLTDMVGTNGDVFCFGGICTQSLSNIKLHPETSWGYDVGFDKRFAQNTIVSFDIYNSDLNGQFYQNSASTGTCTICGGQPLFITQFSNLAQTRYQGIDLDIRRDAPRGIVWSLSGSLMRGYIVNVPAGFYNAPGGTCNFTTGVNCANATVVRNINFNGVFTTANVPYAQGFAMYGYRWSPDRFLTADVHYFGNNNGYYAPAFVVFDANAQLPLTKHVALQGTFLNITGQLDGAVGNLGQGYIYPTAFGPSAYVESIQYNPRTFLLTLRLH